MGLTLFNCPFRLKQFLSFSSYRGGVDSEGHPVMVVVGAHFLLRCLDLERFVLYVVKVLDHMAIFLSETRSALQMADQVSCLHRF